MQTLRLILGDQLNQKHSWFKNPDDTVVYVMAELSQETDYVLHHIQKVVGFFAAMRHFAQWLREQGHRVDYFKITDAQNPQTLEALIQESIKRHQISRLEYLLPDEYRLDVMLAEICNKLDIASQPYDTEHFFTTREELSVFFTEKKTFLMESFYRHMRLKHQILVDGANPRGGKWNYDHNNRSPFKGEVAVAPPKVFSRDVSGIVSEIAAAGIKTFGSIAPTAFDWPTSREESLEILKHFCLNLLEHFGDYQDAMAINHPFLFHSRLSFAMNTKMIGPKEVVKTILNYYEKYNREIKLPEVEGFIRQILGWREYMRGMYWMRMPEFAAQNALQHQQPLPRWFWNGNTKMNCLHHAIGQSLELAYAHHIQRLMVIGNFALLAQTHPNAVDDWYLGVYIDALEWVEMPNTRGMSQWADGGIIATKPYIASGNYINKMSDYCKGCVYDVKKRTSKDACPFNSLYWNFLDDHRTHFENNPRMTMMLALLDKIKPSELSQIKEKAQELLATINDL